jgi:hypothetical protein
MAAVSSWLAVIGWLQAISPAFSGSSSCHALPAPTPHALREAKRAEAPRFGSCGTAAQSSRQQTVNAAYNSLTHVFELMVSILRGRRGYPLEVRPHFQQLAIDFGRLIRGASHGFGQHH